MLRRVESYVAAANRDDAIRKFQFLQQRFCVVREGVVCVERSLWCGEPDELDLVELMLTHESARILACRTGLFAKAWRARDVLARQFVELHNLAAAKRRKRNFGRRNHEEIGLVVLKHRV